MSSSIISKCHNVVTWETDTCFEKAKVLNDFLNDISKSRNRDFCSRKFGEGGGGGQTWFLLSKGYKGKALKWCTKINGVGDGGWQYRGHHGS